MADHWAIEAAGLTKTYGAKKVLDETGLRVAPGIVFSLLDPNGAGKTTMVRILSTLLRPDGGRARVAGFDVVRDRRQVRRRISLGVGSATTAVTVSKDMAGGIIDRFRSMDVGSLPLLSGHVAASVVRNAASTVLVFAVALGIGFRPHASLAAWAATAGILLLYVLAISWLATAFGLLVSSPEAANAFMFVPMIMAYASSAFVPVRTTPSWLLGVAGHQPATPVIETMRGLLLGTHVGANGWQDVAWCGGIFVGSVGLSAAAFRRRTR